MLMLACMQTPMQAPTPAPPGPQAIAPISCSSVIEPDTQAVVTTRSDLVMVIDYVTGDRVVQDSDGSRVTTYASGGFMVESAGLPPVNGGPSGLSLEPMPGTNAHAFTIGVLLMVAVSYFGPGMPSLNTSICTLPEVMYTTEFPIPSIKGLHEAMRKCNAMQVSGCMHSERRTAEHVDQLCAGSYVSQTTGRAEYFSSACSPPHPLHPVTTLYDPILSGRPVPSVTPLHMDLNASDLQVWF